MNLRLIPFLLGTHIERISFQTLKLVPVAFYVYIYVYLCDAVCLYEFISRNTFFSFLPWLFLLLLLFLLCVVGLLCVFFFAQIFFLFAIFKRVTTRPKPHSASILFAIGLPSKTGYATTISISSC